MKNTVISWVIFRRIMLFLFLIFIVLYFQVETGVNPELQQKTIITQESIQKFEDDIKNGEYIDLKNYIETSNVDTSNFMSDAGYMVSKGTSKFVGKYLVDFFEFVGKLIK